MTTMKMRYEALTHEAKEWDDTDAALTTAAGVVTWLGLTQAEFSWLASTTGCDQSYEAAREFVMQVLWAGETETEKLANALRTIRKDFEGTDAKVKTSLKGQWDPQ